MFVSLPFLCDKVRPGIQEGENYSGHANSLIINGANGESCDFEITWGVVVVVVVENSYHELKTNIFFSDFNRNGKSFFFL